MKLNKYLYNTIIVLFPLILFYVIILIITKEPVAIKNWTYTIISLRLYFLWGLIFFCYFVIYHLYNMVKYFIFLIPTIVIAITAYKLFHNYGADAIMGFLMFHLPVLLASIVYPTGAIFYKKLYKSAE